MLEREVREKHKTFLAIIVYRHVANLFEIPQFYLYTEGRKK